MSVHSENHTDAAAVINENVKIPNFVTKDIRNNKIDTLPVNSMSL